MIKIYGKNEIKNGEVFKRNVPLKDVSAAVTEIINDVRNNGDEALIRLTEKFDRVKLSNIGKSPDTQASEPAACPSRAMQATKPGSL